MKPTHSVEESALVPERESNGSTVIEQEWPRKLLHMAATSLALALLFLTRWEAALLTALFVPLNWLFVRRLDRRRLFSRPNEDWRGGIVLYPASIFFAIIALPYPAGPMAVWGVLGVGDACASLVGRWAVKTRWGQVLPWNPRKTWAGSLALFLTGSAAAWMLLATHRLSLHQGLDEEIGALFFYASVAAFVAAVAESFDTRLADNLRVVLGASAGYLAVWWFIA